jgi:alkanesulfonate monooxygenase SsuD/methylene tetrahydromethanopterin reductase-like flavin-dependent oxidoreductase (luciferase family)
VVARLWDSWEDDALIRDIATGRYVDRTKLHYVDFDGRFFRVRGPSITPRSPQAQPPIAVDVTTPAALGVAAERADLAFIHEADVAAATARQGEIRGATEAAGRDPDAVAVLATIDVLLAPTTSEAREERLRLDSLAGSDAASSSAAVDFTGTPADLAALMADWFDAGAVDGFVIRPAVLPRDLTRLVVDVVPRLQQPGVFRREYSSSTLRGHFGWARPQNRYETADAP